MYKKYKFLKEFNIFKVNGLKKIKLLTDSLIN